MSECAYCGAADAPDSGILVGKIREGGDSQCTICRADYLKQNTTLSQREAEVVAHKQITGASHQTISERLGISKSAVDKYSSRLKSKAATAAVTADELSEFY